MRGSYTFWGCDYAEIDYIEFNGAKTLLGRVDGKNLQNNSWRIGLWD